MLMNVKTIAHTAPAIDMVWGFVRNEQDGQKTVVGSKM